MFVVFRRGSFAALVLAFAGLLASTAHGLGETLRVGGTGAALGTMKMLSGPFAAAHPGVEVDVLPSLGSGGGVRALGKGVVDVAVIAGELGEADRANGFVAVPYGSSPLVFVTSRADRQSVSTAEVADILAGRRLAWPDGRPIRLVMRPRKESDYLMLGAYTPAMRAAIEMAGARSELPIAVTDQDALDMLESLEGSFGFSTLAAVVSEKRRLSVLALDGVAPTLDAVAGGAYGFVKSFQLVLRRDSGPRAQAFAAFATSPEGRRLVRAAGNLPTVRR